MIHSTDHYLIGFLRVQLLAICCQANCMADTDGQFNNIATAAFAAGERYNTLSIREDREYMGGILSNGESFSYTVTRGKKGQDRVTARIRIPSGSRLVAFWHTHGAYHDSRKYFSDVDTELVESYGLPFYLIDPDGYLWVFSPGDRTLTASQSKRYGLGAGTGYAKGKFVPGAHQAIQKES